MLRVIAVACGGMFGSIARYWLSGVVQRIDAVAAGDFPVGTLSVNVLGSFLIGLFVALSLDRGLIGAEWRIFLTIGVCGGFTTMSTFSYETLILLREGSLALASGNVVITMATTLVAVWLGLLMGRVV